MNELTAGLDVHSKRTVFVIQRTADGSVVGRGDFATDVPGLTRWRDEYGLAPGTVVGLETGTVSFFVARILQRLKLKPKVLDAAEVRIKARRPNQKCDRRDAFEICDGVRRDIYRCEVHVPSLVVSSARSAISRRRHCVRGSTREINAAKHLLRAAGLGVLATGALKTEKAWEKLLKKLATEPELQGHVRAHYALWRGAVEQLAELDGTLADMARHEELREDIEILRTIPGVGPVVSMTLVAGFSETARFPSAKHAASYVGLVPSTFSSGEREASGHITKRGSPEMRSMLCEAAQHAAKPTHPLYPYFSALSARRGYNMAITATAHRLCRIAFRMLRTRSPFDVQQLNVEACAHVRTRRVDYKRKDRSLPRGAKALASTTSKATAAASS